MIVAVCLVVLQSFAGVLAFGVAPANAQSDIFASSLCTSTGEVSFSSHDDSSRQPSHLVDCCKWGCSMFASALAPLLDAVGPVAHLSQARIAHAVVTAIVWHVDVQSLPGNPRAPPVII